MRRIATAVSAVAVVFLSASLFAQAKPNFSGKWAPDAEKTMAAMPGMAAGGGGGAARAGGGGGGRGGAAGPMTVTMDAAMLKIERAGQDGTMMATTYKLDGSESKNMAMGRGGQTEQVSHAKIDGAKVVITTAGANGDQVSSWYMEGDWLVSERTTPNGPQKTYYKKG